MTKGNKIRAILMSIVIFIMMIVLIFGLASATMSTSSNALYDQEESQKQFDPDVTITLRGTRGKILDSNGQPLAYNKPSYDVQFIRATKEERRSENRPLYTESIIKAIEVIKRYGGKIIDTYPIYRNPETLEYYFDWGITNKKAIASRRKSWFEDMKLSQDQEAEDIYEYMRSWLYIPENYSYDEAREVLSIWNDIQRNSSKSYLPITIANNVSEEAVAEIESRSEELIGITTTRSTMRIYPQAEYASHVIGYTGKLSAREAEVIETMTVQDGYSMDDRIGVSGIESTMEQYLTGSTTEHHGHRVLEVTRKNEVVRQTSAQAPTDGNDVVLTLDMDMQKVAYDALEENILKTREEQQQIISENIEKYQAKMAARGKDVNDIKLAETASVVVMQVNTGNVIAMGSYPSYDNNDFIIGLTKDEYKKKYDDNEQVPMLNRAIASKTMPGSIFKMATGWAALQEGVITVDEGIDDEGYYIVKEQRELGNMSTVGAPRCWISLDQVHLHADQTISKALENSCNYYFFTVAERMGIDAMVPWIEQLGLATKTGIELPGELAGRIGGQKVLFDNQKPINELGLAGLVQRKLVTMLREYCESANIKITDDQLFIDCANELMLLVDAERDSNTYGPPIRQIMQEHLGIPQVLSSSRNWTIQIYSVIRDLKWNPNQTIRTGIGQAVVEVTPIAAARYVAALVNGGTVYNASIVDRVIDKDGKTIEKFEPSIAQQLNTNPAYLEAIKTGMNEVFSAEDGSASKRFKQFEYISEMGGKTGTAQISTAANNIDIENTSWLVTFVPYNNPEIVIVSCMPYGYAGSYSDTIHKRIVSHYFERKESEIKKTVIENNGILN